MSNQVNEREIAIIVRELKAVINQKIPGDVVEFGCYVGTTSVFLARILNQTQKTLYLYDSFEGLPEKSAFDHSPAGLQFQKGELKATKKQLIDNLIKAHVPKPIITKAWFNELTKNSVPSSIAFAFLDGDYYQSIKSPLLLIQPHLAPRSTIIVDDYANEALPGAAKAVDEWLGSRPGAKLQIEQSLAIIHT